MITPDDDNEQGPAGAPPGWRSHWLSAPSVAALGTLLVVPALWGACAALGADGLAMLLLPAGGLVVACFVAARILAAVHRRDRPAIVRWVGAAVVGVVLMVIADRLLRGPGLPAVGTDVALVLEELGPPERDSRADGSGSDEAYTLYFRVDSYGFRSMYVVEVTGGRVSATDVWSR